MRERSPGDSVEAGVRLTCYFAFNEGEPLPCATMIARI